MKKILASLFKLIPEEAEHETYLEIIEGTRLKGYNFWVMGFAMIIACIGLNVDSSSAIVGAMLISPLMGPILGFAFGLALNDGRLKKISLMNWFYMTLISLAASTLFFLLTPFDFNTVQLSGFKQATIFDILLAFFGGMAGFIGVLKKEGTKILAGVAIATTCMPALCTAGYGIAHLDWKFALGGMYFYLINCLFIGLATFFLARFTQMHIRLNREVKIQGWNKWLWTLVIIVMTIPSIYLAYIKWQGEIKKQRYKSDTERIQELEYKVKQLDSLLNASVEGRKMSND